MDVLTFARCTGTFFGGVPMSKANSSRAALGRILPSISKWAIRFGYVSSLSVEFHPQAHLTHLKVKSRTGAKENDNDKGQESFVGERSPCGFARRYRSNDPGV